MSKLGQALKPIEVGEVIYIPYTRNPMGKIKAVIKYGQKKKRFYLIDQDHKKKRLRIKRQT